MEKKQSDKNLGGGGASLVDEKELQRALGDCVFSSSWVWSIAGALIAIPYGVRAKSLMPLVFFGTTGAMLDIIQGFAGCEKERDALRKFLEEKKAAFNGGGLDQASTSGEPQATQDIAEVLPEFADPRSRK